MKISIKILSFTFTLLLFMLPMLLMAQPEGNGGDPGVDAPIDGGLSILLAAGAAYGIKKVKDNSKKKD